MEAAVKAEASAFVSDVAALRARAHRHIEEGAVTPSGGAHQQTVLKLLNEVLATEMVCVLRYQRHYLMAEGLHSEPVKKAFRRHATNGQARADRIAERIVQLGGEPNVDPDGLKSRSHAEHQAGTTLRDMITEDLMAKRIAIKSYAEMVAYLQGRHDSTTRKLLEDIAAAGEEHAEDMASLLKHCARSGEP